MTLKVRWTAHATHQFEQAARRLEDARPTTGRRFIDEMDEALTIIAEFPYANPRVPDEPKNTRKAVLARYGYWIVYEVHTDHVVILTVWHAVQEPGTWRKTDEP